MPVKQGFSQPFRLLLGQRIRTAITESGRSQHEMAELLEVRPATVSDWIRGKATPSLEYLVRIADLTRPGLDELLVGHEGQSDTAVLDAAA